MNEEHETQPVPIETESALPKQRHHRPRRSYPRRRYRDRGVRIDGDKRQVGRGSQLSKLINDNGEEPTKCQGLRRFEEWSTIKPYKLIKRETSPARYPTMIMDLMKPLGMG